MKAFALDRSMGAVSLREITLEGPVPTELEAAIAVKAAGVTPTELQWYPSTHTGDGAERLNAVPGHEFSGVVTAVGPGIARFRVGDEVFGMNDWFAEGATAEMCVAAESDIIAKPAGISHTTAAAVPISALTAWQGIVERAAAKPGERVLVLGAAGSVGLFAVQIAARLGCEVIASASNEHASVLKSLGCKEVLDYRSVRFEQHLREIDVVFDTVGSDGLLRAEQILSPGGRMVTIAADAEGSDDPRIKAAFFIVTPSAGQLENISALIERGELQVFVKGVLPFADARKAYLERDAVQGIGKLVLRMSEEE